MTDQTNGPTPPDEPIRHPDGTVDIHHHTALPTTGFSDALDRLVAGVGKLFSWLWLAVIAVILISVVSRYAFGKGSIMLEELSWYIYATVWTVGMAYTFVTDDHVRVDVLHERFSLKTQAWIELFGILVLLSPFLVISAYYGAPYFWDSFLQGETSPAPSGLSARWFVKFFIPLSFILLQIAAISRVAKCTALLFGWPKPRAADLQAHK